MNTKVKPRIVWNSASKRYVCHDNYFICGFGNSPWQAYNAWVKKENIRTLIPRKGIWERRNCRQWFKRGCPTIRSYIGDKQIVGYLWNEDTLILRG